MKKRNIIPSPSMLARGVPLLFLFALCLWVTPPAEAQEQRSFKVLSVWDDADQSLADAPLSHANPDAPKGGTLRLTASGTFDSFNPFSPRGMAAGRLPLTYETLATTAEGDDFAMRGLLAEKFIIPDDRSWVEVHLRPEARFSDGKPVTARDVVYSFTALTTEGSPMYKNYYANVTGVEPTGKYSVKFTFGESHNRELPLIITQLPVLPSHWWEGRDLGDPTNIPMPGSGPYQVASFKMGSSITLQRDKNWWGNDLSMHKGRYNFDTIQIDYYRSMPVAREAFLAGEADFFMENTIKDWFSAYDSPDIRSGRIVKAEIPQHASRGITGFFFNTRSPKFADRRVRQAIALLFDFEWTNKRLFHNAYTRCDSFFSGSLLAAGETLSAAEKGFLRSLGQPIPYDLDSPTPRQPVSDASGNIRDRLRQAMTLLAEAGWELSGGKMTNASGEQLQFTLSLVSPNMQRVALPFRRNLERIGIRMDVEVPDQTRYVSQVRSFEYDMILSTVRQSDHPGNEQRNFWSSATARSHGSRNFAGISEPLIDTLVERLIAAGNREELVTACRALDWLLLQGWYVIPGWYSKDVRIAWRAETIAPPEQHPKTGFDITTWYTKSPEKNENSSGHSGMGATEYGKESTSGNTSGHIGGNIRGNTGGGNQ